MAGCYAASGKDGCLWIVAVCSLLEVNNHQGKDHPDVECSKQL
jgi:hypothetical protein